MQRSLVLEITMRNVMSINALAFGPHETGRVSGSVLAAIEHVTEIFRESGHGIWEVYEKQRHFVHSKLMCRQALRAGIALLRPRILCLNRR